MQAVGSAGTGEVIGALTLDTSVLRVPAEPVEIAMPRYIADTLPAEDRTPGEVVPIDPEGPSAEPGEDTPEPSGKKLTPVAIAGIICGCLAAIGIAATAVVLGIRKKQK